MRPRVRGRTQNRKWVTNIHLSTCASDGSRKQNHPNNNNACYGGAGHPPVETKESVAHGVAVSTALPAGTARLGSDPCAHNSHTGTDHSTHPARRTHAPPSNNVPCAALRLCLLSYG